MLSIPLHAFLIRCIQFIPALSLAVTVSGCASPASYTDPIVKYQKASTVVIESARIEYAGANTYERNAIVDRLAARKQKFGLAEISGPEHEVIAPIDLRARLQAIEALAKHGELLLTLASSDAPKRSKEAALQLGDSLGRLSDSLKVASDSEFKTKASTFGKIAGEVVDSAVQAKITQALNQAIESTDAAVSDLIRQIRRDMYLLYERRRTILSQGRVLAVDAYNAEVSQTPSSVERVEKAAARVKAATAAYDNLELLVGAGQGLDAMADAHQQLVAYARSAKSPQNLSDLVDAVDVFVARAVVIAEAINALHNSKEE